MNKRYNFNLIEIVLTVAVEAFGVVIILGMLPKGMTAARNASAASYASSVIEQIGTALQLQGASKIESTSFSDNQSACDDESICKNYVGLVSSINGEPDEEVMSKYKLFASGVFKHTDFKDVYVVVMGNSEEIDGERITNLDFSGMIRVCKKDGTTMTVPAIDHTSDANHECFGSDGKLKCTLSVADQNYAGSTVYMELSYPLSLPYADRTKLYYSFDVKQ